METDPAGRLDGPTETLIRRIYPRLRRFAAVAGSPRSEPDDLVQEALLRTLRTRSLIDLDHPEAYLRRAILNIADNDRRTAARHDHSLTRFNGGNAPGATDSYPSDLADLTKLPAMSRAVLYMSVVEGATHAEIASALGITEPHSRMVATRARRALTESKEQDAE